MAGVLIVSDPAAHAALKSVFAAGAAALCCASAGEARRALLGVIGVLQSALSLTTLEHMDDSAPASLHGHHHEEHRP